MCTKLVENHCPELEDSMLFTKFSISTFDSFQEIIEGKSS